MKRLLVAAAFAACTMSVFALPSVEAVKAEVAKGHDVQAEQMIREVLEARPDSARARYVHAEILAHEGRFRQAAEEAAQARRLDPALSFTQPETFRAFEALLAREQSAGGASSRAVTATPHLPAAAPAGGVPTWVWAGGLGLMALLVLRRFAAPSAPYPAAAPAGMPAAAPAGMGATALPYGSGPSMPVGGGFGGGGSGGGSGGGAGSGLLGTGLAVAGGVAAGMLAERLFEGHRETVPGAFWAAAPTAAPLQTFDNTATEAAAARELEERPIDMGNGDGWGGADTDSSADSTGSGSSDGW